MSKTKPFKELSDRVTADPERAKRVAKAQAKIEKTLPPQIGERVLFCIRDDAEGKVWRSAEVLNVSIRGEVQLVVSLVPREPVAAGARVTRPHGTWHLHGYAFDAREGDGVGCYKR